MILNYRTVITFGQKNIDQEGEWTGYGQAYFVPDTMMNIVSVSDAVSKGFHIFFDSKHILNNLFTYLNNNIVNTVYEGDT